jgi:hypothetical protein
MALPPADPVRHRRQQLRRALIGWIAGGGLLALFVVAAILGGDGSDESEPISAHAASLFDYHLSSDQFEGLRTGETETAVLEELGKVGLPEGETPIEVIELFPHHDDSVLCSYWEISDAGETAARLCFSRPDGILRQKLERDLSGLFEGESAIRA